ncbi:hypothetical protein ACFFX0_01790 [Citricoccus parietis]|uniref:Uncharacterized protein n=1 Tax=Citricoccus parietis TaxID=592307 RepID=A0ABV5FU70_9MICC
MLPHLMRQAMGPDGVQTRVDDGDLQVPTRRRVMGPGIRDVFLQSGQETHWWPFDRLAPDWRRMPGRGEQDQSVSPGCPRTGRWRCTARRSPGRSPR